MFRFWLEGSCHISSTAPFDRAVAKNKCTLNSRDVKYQFKVIVALLGVMQVRWSARMSDICELHTFTGPVRRVAFSDVPEGAVRRYLIKHLLQQLLTPRKICFSSDPRGKITHRASGVSRWSRWSSPPQKRWQKVYWLSNKVPEARLLHSLLRGKTDLSRSGFHADKVTLLRLKWSFDLLIWKAPSLSLWSSQGEWVTASHSAAYLWSAADPRLACRLLAGITESFFGKDDWQWSPGSAQLWFESWSRSRSLIPRATHYRLREEGSASGRGGVLMRKSRRGGAKKKQSEVNTEKTNTKICFNNVNHSRWTTSIVLSPLIVRVCRVLLCVFTFLFSFKRCRCKDAATVRGKPTMSTRGQWRTKNDSDRSALTRTSLTTNNHASLKIINHVRRACLRPHVHAGSRVDANYSQISRQYARLQEDWYIVGCSRVVVLKPKIKLYRNIFKFIIYRAAPRTRLFPLRVTSLPVCLKPLKLLFPFQFIVIVSRLQFYRHIYKIGQIKNAEFARQVANISRIPSIFPHPLVNN